MRKNEFWSSEKTIFSNRIKNKRRKKLSPSGIELIQRKKRGVDKLKEQNYPKKGSKEGRVSSRRYIFN